MPRPKGGGKSDWVKLAIAGIDGQIKELTNMRDQLSKLSTGSVSAPAAPGRPAGRKRAAVKAAASKPAKKKRVVSAATRRKLKESAKARWARIRAEKGQ